MPILLPQTKTKAMAKFQKSSEKDYASFLKYYDGFPKEGINFVDIMPLLQDKALMKEITKDLGQLCGTPNVAAPEARGFLFAAPLLTSCRKIKCIVPLRKKGKLPYAEGDLVNVEIMKEYGSDIINYRLSDIAACKVNHLRRTINLTFFDDVLATGGTAKGIVESLNSQTVVIDCKTYKVKVTDMVFLVELKDLGGRKLLEDIAPVKSLIVQ